MIEKIKVIGAVIMIAHMWALPYVFVIYGIVEFGWPPELSLWKDIFWAITGIFWISAPGLLTYAVMYGDGQS